MQIVRTQAKDGFIWYECNYKGQTLLHWDLLTLLNDILFFFGVDLKKHLFNYSLN